MTSAELQVLREEMEQSHRENQGAIASAERRLVRLDIAINRSERALRDARRAIERILTGWPLP